MLYPSLEKKLQASKHLLNSSNNRNIVDNCKAHLALLAEYRGKLYDNQPETIEDRAALSKAIETTTLERNRTHVLLLSFTTVSGYEAVEVFNEHRYEGHNDWELRAGGVRSLGESDDNVMTIREAVELAGLLRREDYLSLPLARR